MSGGTAPRHGAGEGWKDSVSPAAPGFRPYWPWPSTGLAMVKGSHCCMLGLGAGQREEAGDSLS